MTITIDNVSKSFGKTAALTDVSLTVDSGSLLCLLGPSGAGKTTLIRLITGAIKADKGKLEADGREIPNRQLLRQMGFMPQNDALYNDLTGLEHLQFFGGLYGMKGASLSARAREVLELMDLAEAAKRPVSGYSGGMKKRLSLAVALLHRPRLLVLDEPTVGIDPVLRQAIWQEFARLQEQGATILVSTHVMDEAAKCKQAALLYNGRLIARGPVPELINRTPGKQIEELFFMAQEGVL